MAPRYCDRVKTTHYFGILGGVVTGLYLTAFLQRPAWFILYLILAAVTLAVCTCLFAAEVVCKFFPVNFRELCYRHKIAFRFIVLSSVLLAISAVSIQNTVRALMIHRPSSNSSPEQLAAIPYMMWVPAKARQTGVTKYDPQRSFSGVNLYSPANLAAAFLIDMKGNVLHSWSARIRPDDTWHDIELMKNGDLLCVVKDRYLLRLGWDSKVKWRLNGRFHHDVRIAPNGDLYALCRKDRIAFLHALPVPVLDDHIVAISADGKIKQDFSLFNYAKTRLSLRRVFAIYRAILYPKALHTSLWNAIKIMNDRDAQVLHEDTIFDVLHTNSVQLLNERGDFLISLLRLNLVIIYNPEHSSSVWEWGIGNLDHSHHATLLQNGNILIFDNGSMRGYSRAVEVHPMNKEIVWEYKSTPSTGFYSVSRGGCQRLANGNTLITESDKGHAFEVTRDGRVVWEFYTPQMEGAKRAAIYRMIRFSDASDYPFLTKISR